MDVIAICVLTVSDDKMATMVAFVNQKVDKSKVLPYIVPTKKLSRQREHIMRSDIKKIREFNRFYTNFIGLLNEKLLESSVSLTEGRILYEIKGTEGCSAADLRRILKIDKGYLSRILSRLERAGLVRKARSVNDRRTKILVLTRGGTKLLEDIDRTADLQMEEILGALGRTERTRMVSAMSDIQFILSGSLDATKKLSDGVME